jgi:dTMP kinase
MSTPGRFITLEGGEGAGKSTQLRRLALTLREAGVDVAATREPGGTEGAEAIRQLLVEGTPGRWLPLTEALLHTAARHDHLERRIAPALADGRWVISDRFHDSTRVYQGLAGGLGLELVDSVMAPVLAGRLPDLTLLLDLPVEIGLRRREEAGEVSRYERMERGFHDRVRDGFLELARREPGRIVVIDATAAPEEVEAQIRVAVARRFAELALRLT